MEIKDYVKQFRDLQKSHKKVRVADFCRENMLDYYEMVEALKQEKLWSGTVFIFMNRRHNQLRVFYYERGGFVISQNQDFFVPLQYE